MTTIVLYIFYFIIGFWVYRLLAFFYDDSKSYSNKKRSK